MEKFKLPNPEKDKGIEMPRIKVPEHQRDEEAFKVLLEKVSKSVEDEKAVRLQEKKSNEGGLLEAVRARLGLAPKVKEEVEAPRRIVIANPVILETSTSRRREILTDEKLEELQRQRTETGELAAQSQEQNLPRRRVIMSDGMSEEQLKSFDEGRSRELRDQQESLERRTEFF